MSVVQAHYRVPSFPDELPGIVARVNADLCRKFYEALDKHLAETPGGCIVGQPRVSQRQEDDWLLGIGGKTTLFSMTANVIDLPLPPEYRLIGGPADGHIVRTAGQRYWYVPVVFPPTLASYADLSEPTRGKTAVYERQGDTSAYFYQRMEE